MSLDSIPCDLFVDISGTDCALPSSKLVMHWKYVTRTDPDGGIRKAGIRQRYPRFLPSAEIAAAGSGEMDEMFYFLITLQAE